VKELESQVALKKLEVVRAHTEIEVLRIQINKVRESVLKGMISGSDSNHIETRSMSETLREAKET